MTSASPEIGHTETIDENYDDSLNLARPDTAGPPQKNFESSWQDIGEASPTGRCNR